MTMGYARYSAEAGPMDPHHHAEEIVVVLTSQDGYVRYGGFGEQPDELGGEVIEFRSFIQNDILNEKTDKVKERDVINFVKNIMEIEESVVVFCHHKVIHKLLHERLEEFSPVSIIGGQTDTMRQDQIDKFQKGESKLMIAGLRAGNVGINLTRAKYVIFAELDWSPAIHRQAEDRLHRIGQKNTVQM